MISVVISRDGTDLTIDDAPLSDFWMPENGLGRPTKEWRRKYADEGLYHGSLLTQATLEQTDLPLRVYCKAASTSALVALQDELEVAVTQFTYTAVVTVDGVARTWTCDPADISWGPVESDMTRAYLALASLVIPVYPIAGA